MSAASIRHNDKSITQPSAMTIQDHRPRVAAERRERMRLRLFASALSLAAEKGPAATSIDDVISHAGVARGTFYKYFISPEAMVQELAIALANELIRMAEPVVQTVTDPAERVCAGMRIISRVAGLHPAIGGFLVRLSWSDPVVQGLLLDYVRRDLAEGLRIGRFSEMPLALAVNIVAGSVLGTIHCMLQPGCEPEFPERSAAAALRALGIDGRTAQRISTRPLAPVDPLPDGLVIATLGLEPDEQEGEPEASSPAASRATKRTVRT
jgi:AcrR family transcriptional regulator